MHVSSSSDVARDEDSRQLSPAKKKSKQHHHERDGDNGEVKGADEEEGADSNADEDDEGGGKGLAAGRGRGDIKAVISVSIHSTSAWKVLEENWWKLPGSEVLEPVKKRDRSLRKIYAKWERHDLSMTIYLFYMAIEESSLICKALSLIGD